MRKIRRTHSKNGKYRFSRKQFILSALLISFFGVGAWVIHEVLYPQATDEWFESTAVNTHAVSLPKDDAPHQAAMEWWYYNGHLNTESGKQYSFHYTVFLVNNVVHHMVSHASVNEHQTGKHYTAQRRTAGNPSIKKENGFEFTQGDWLMIGGNGNDKLKIITDEFSLDLSLTNTYPPIYHGGNGIISMWDAGDSYYYSRSRMAASGVIKIGDTSEKVTGISWFDHQWGDFSVGVLKWDWFSLQLNDGMDVMIYQLREKKTDEPILYTGSISQNGNTETLSAADFMVVPGKKWTSNKSSIVYPMEWVIEIPSRNIYLEVKSISENSEFDAMLTTYNIYWEGAVKVQGSHTGLGFMELYYMDNKR